MGKKMLIDAAHREETRVVVLDNNNQIDEFDYESASKKLLKGNIYLAKVTRVEPSLQAAFVEYGGNRHGFLAFSEIHPDYYQIPVADRQALQEIAAEERREAERLEANDGEDKPEETSARKNGRRRGRNAKTPDVETKVEAVAEEDPAIWGTVAKRSGEPATCEDAGLWTKAFERSVERGDLDESFVEVASDDDDDVQAEVRPRKRRYAKRYKIQEVIKRRQVMLVQIVKEERGNKGAAVTSYLSLAGRYGVLMPNTNRGGGISRKIAQVSDRKRLRSAVSELHVPDGMGLIIRTAGAERTKAEIKRDYEYLMRLWENVRELTLKSSAPTLVYEEGSLIKRSIRDLYNKDIDTILVEGEEGYKEAKAFMKMLIPSHAKNVQPYRDPTPLYQRYKAEGALEAMFNPVVQLKSGGYIVIDPTEALISIDVNSGRATREHSIEETALKTNLEAAAEAARQFKLRDLAGLIVIDFIDMEDHRNNRAVERKMKDSLKDDRARIQVGRISMFGLLEMSRQRMRAGLHESGTIVCPHCEGVGRIRSLENTVLSCLRMIEEEGMKARTASATLQVPTDIGMYLLNNKRGELHRIEEQYALHVIVDLVASMAPMERELVRGVSLSKSQMETIGTAIRFDGEYEPDTEDDDDNDVIDVEAEEVEETPAAKDETQETDAEKPKRKRRRRRGRDRDDQGDTGTATGTVTGAGDDTGETSAAPATEEAVNVTAGSSDVEQTGESAEEDGDDDKKPRRRRRGRRGGRRNRKPGEEDGNADEVSTEGAEAEGTSDPIANEPVTIEIQDEVPEEVAEVIADEPVEALVAADVEVLEASNDDSAPEADNAVADEKPAKKEKSAKPTKRGWWQRKDSA